MALTRGNQNRRILLSSLFVTSLIVLGMFAILPMNSVHAQQGPSDVNIQTYTTFNGTTSSQDLIGYYVTLWQNGKVIQSCYSWCAFTFNDGMNYQVAVSDYGNWCFSFWLVGSDHNTSRFQNVYVPSGSDALLYKAYYAQCNTGSSVTVNSVNQNGNSINGYYTILRTSGGSTIATGFTPKTFSTTSGQSYTIQADSYGSCTFFHWSNGATSDPMPFRATSNAETFTAVYNCGGTGSSSVTINSVNQNGNAISGYYVVLYNSGGSVIGTGLRSYWLRNHL